MKQRGEITMRLPQLKRVVLIWVVATLLLGSCPALAVDLGLRFTGSPPERIRIAETVKLSWEALDPFAELRYKLDTPGDWKYGLQHALRQWSDWGLDTQVIYSGFVVEGEYTLTVEGRDPLGGTQKISHRFQVDFVPPEVLKEGVEIDREKVLGTKGRQAKLRALAAEYEQAYKVWSELYDLRRRELKASYEPEKLVGFFTDLVITEMSTRLVKEFVDQEVGRAMEKALVPKLLFDILAKGGETLTLSVLNYKTNEAALKTVYSYWMWKSAEKAAASATSEEPGADETLVATGPGPNGKDLEIVGEWRFDCGNMCELTLVFGGDGKGEFKQFNREGFPGFSDILVVIPFAYTIEKNTLSIVYLDRIKAAKLKLKDYVVQFKIDGSTLQRDGEWFSWERVKDRGRETENIERSLTRQERSAVETSKGTGAGQLATAGFSDPTIDMEFEGFENYADSQDLVNAGWINKDGSSITIDSTFSGSGKRSLQIAGGNSYANSIEKNIEVVYPYTVEYKVMNTGCGGHYNAGFYFGDKKTGDFWHLDFAWCGSIHLFQKDSGVIQINTAWPTNAWVSVKVVADNNEIAIYLDNTFLGKYPHRGHNIDTIGLGRAYGGDATARFDEINISGSAGSATRGNVSRPVATDNGGESISLKLGDWKNTSVYMGGRGPYPKGVSVGRESGQEHIRLDGRDGSNYYVNLERVIPVNGRRLKRFSFEWKVPAKASSYGINHLWLVFMDRAGNILGKVGAFDTSDRVHTHDYLRGKVPVNCYAAKSHFNETFDWEKISYTPEDLPGVDFGQVSEVKVSVSIQNNAGRGGELLFRNIMLARSM